jgi:hypothetical protein
MGGSQRAGTRRFIHSYGCTHSTFLDECGVNMWASPHPFTSPLCYFSSSRAGVDRSPSRHDPRTTQPAPLAFCFKQAGRYIARACSGLPRFASLEGRQAGMASQSRIDFRDGHNDLAAKASPSARCPGAVDQVLNWVRRP